MLFLFVCFGVYRSTREFSLIVTITIEGLQTLTHSRYLWPLSSEGSLECHTYLDTGHPFTLVISELSLPVFTTKVCSGWDLNTQTSSCGANALTHCVAAVVICYSLYLKFITTVLSIIFVTCM